MSANCIEFTLFQAVKNHMSRFSSKEAKDVSWRVRQIHANNAIEGIKKDEALVALVEEWNAAGVADDKQIVRLVKMAKQRNRAAA